MALKKSNLSPEVRTRLRQAVLGAITPEAPKNKPVVATAKSAPPAIKFNKPSLKTLNKISSGLKPATPLMTNTSETKPIVPKITTTEKSDNVKPLAATKSAVKSKAKSKAKTKAKTAKVKKPSTRAKAVKATPKVEAIVAAKPVVAKPIYGKSTPVYKPDWTKPEANKQSLESLFNAPKSSLTKTGGFFKKPLTPTPTAEVKSAKPIIPFLKKDPTAVAKKSGLRSIIKFLIIIILVLVLLLGFDILGIYQFGFRDSVSSQVAQTLQLPAGAVNGNSIKLTDYMSDMKLLNLPLTEKREGLIDYSTKTDIKDKIFYRLAALDIMTKKLASYQKSVTAQDVDKQVSLLLQQTGGREQAEKVVKSIYGLDLSQFSDKVLKPMLLRENLQLAIMSDDTLDINKAAKSQAEEVLKLARVSSTDFSALAKQYTGDEASVNTGGDLGWVVKGQLDPQWENLIFKASSSTIIPQIVKSNFGYHIIKVEQKLIDPISNTESVKLRHILIKVDIDKYIKELLDGAQVVKYVK